MVRSGVVVKRVALGLLATGSLLLGFVAYQLWGTALYEHSAQARLQQELRHTLHTTGTLPSIPKNAGSTQSFQGDLSHVAPPMPDPAVGAAVGLISIPALGITNTALVEGTAESQLQQGPGHYPGTPLPGQAGNSAIAGHRTTYGAPFYDLDKLHSGDAIDVQTAQGIFAYQVVTTRIVSPDDVSVLQPTALPELTLTTCNPRYSATSRLVVQALLRTGVTSGSFTSSPPAGRGSSAASTKTHPSSGQPGSDVAGGVTGAVLWGIGVLLAAAAGWLAYRRLRGNRRWLGLVGWAAALVMLLPCFQHVSLVLPASF